MLDVNAVDDRALAFVEPSGVIAALFGAKDDLSTK
jgi:hypothetical protein